MIKVVIPVKMRKLFRCSTREFMTILAILSLSLILLPFGQFVYARPTSILALNINNIDRAIQNHDRLSNIAKLHNILSAEEQNILTAQHNVLVCVEELIVPYSMATNGTLSFTWDGPITDMIVKHELGNNQTMINIAHAYLKARGIQ